MEEKVEESGGDGGMTSEFAIAVHALVFLEHKGVVVSSEELAKNVCTNPARIRKVMAKLKKADLIKTKEGTEGGYLFFQEAKAVTLAMVAEALQISFVSTSWRSGDPEKKCCVASGMADVMAGIYEELNTCCKNHLQQMTVADVREEIFRVIRRADEREKTSQRARCGKEGNRPCSGAGAGCKRKLTAQEEKKGEEERWEKN